MAVKRMVSQRMVSQRLAVQRMVLMHPQVDLSLTRIRCDCWLIFIIGERQGTLCFWG